MLLPFLLLAPPPSDDKGGIAASIIVMLLLVVTLAGLLAFYLWKRQRSSTSGQAETPASCGISNAAYNPNTTVCDITVNGPHLKNNQYNIARHGIWWWLKKKIFIFATYCIKCNIYFDLIAVHILHIKRSHPAASCEPWYVLVNRQKQR